MKHMVLFSILCFVFITIGVTSISAQNVCMDKGHFRPNDTYDANRRLILSSLPSNVTSQEGLFFNGSIGQEPNRVYATGMCIPGSTPQDCSDCIKIASDRLIESCSNQTNAFTWLGDPTLCLVRYASTSFSGSGDLTPRSMVTNGGYIASNKTEFKKTWEDLVARMIDVASTGKSTSAALTSSQNMYALMQCTPDVSSRDCKNCLRQSANDFHSCCALKRGTRILRPICFFRWELYDYSTASFAANFTVASSSPSHLPPVVVPEPADDQDNTIYTDRKGISSRVVAAITVPTVVILLVLGVFLCCRRKSMQRTQVESDSDISTPHSSQYDFKTIEVATNKFSRSNKLGEGGFGEVYKGTLSNGTEVAVKRLSEKSGQGIREFKNEAVLVSKLQHRNLVRLLGFCLEGVEKILIYEFVPNKSLDYFLFDPERQSQLDWIQRYNIIEGIARGILYLHQDSQLTIILLTRSVQTSPRHSMKQF
ncbi:cysteine-rich receptor-like protein kinase 11 isoform X2 [Brassica napus]|uniref:cysteine-rich receptor-like protein kinase 11 isoform X2 n=1 Tax=Brassica napus TaxID=3708 RepID=UPI0006AA5D40|nr:cysteine-rich receptor-like protein kinase 11 isoform X2 [Brassica napus]